jgi:exosortase E/protease (VPEID-CTERM system)
MQLILRVVIAVMLLAFEKILLSFLVDSNAGQNASGLSRVTWFAQHFGLRFLVTFATALALFAYAQDNPRLKAVGAAAREIPWRPGWLVLHALLLVPLAVLAHSFYGGHGLQLPTAVLVALWLALGLSSLAALFTAMASWKIWCDAAGAFGVLWVYAAAVGGAGAYAIGWSQMLWAPMTRITFSLVERVVVLIIPGLQSNPATQILDTGRFAVQVNELCSGLEGAGLLLAFCCVWLLYFRREYRFPRALLIIPVGLSLLFVLNILRISMLVLIGNAGYPDIAIYGFHSQAGWIAFNSTAAGIAYLSLRSPWFSHQEHSATPDTVPNPTATYLLPFLAILAAGMLSRAASGQFETLYPLRLIAGALAIWYFWPRLRALDFRFSWRGIATGIAVFAMWIGAGRLLAHSSPMPAALVAMSPPGRQLWIAARILGSVVTVPIAEELAYRGFLMRRVVSAEFESVRFSAVGIWALLLSSVAFGVGHGPWWLPGTVAGFLYGALLIRTGRIGEAVAAHATTNGLIAVWVLLLQQWQLW